MANDFLEQARQLVNPLTVGRLTSFRAGNRVFEVKKTGAFTYHLRDTGIQSRSRFGSRAEIIRDVAAALEGGALPGPSGRRW